METRKESLLERIGTFLMAGAMIGGSAHCYRIILYDLDPRGLLLYLGLGCVGVAVATIGLLYEPIVSKKGLFMFKTVLQLMASGVLTYICWVWTESQLSDLSEGGFALFMVGLAVTTVPFSFSFHYLLKLMLGRGRHWI